MKIEKNTVVNFHYQLLDESGAEIEASDSSNNETAMAVLIGGYGNILPGIEEALQGKETGEALSVPLPPERAYGLAKESAIQRVSIKHLLGVTKKTKLKIGQAVKINTEQGAKDATVVKVGKFNVDVDTNHPLAGKTLTFNINVVDVREASEDEVAHKHAHGVGGHHH